MITLKEENVRTWNRMTFTSYRGMVPLAIQSHSGDKIETNITTLSNDWMVGKPLSKDAMLQVMIALSHKDGILKDVYNKELVDKDPEGKEKYVVHLFRKIQHPDYPTAQGVLYYDLLLNITPPYLYNERIGKRLTPEEWIKKLELINPTLAGWKDIDPAELIYRPFILAQGFTGGFKPAYMYKGSRYEGKGSGPVHSYNAEDLYQVPAPTAQDFEALISYQNQSRDTMGTVFRAWDRFKLPNGEQPFANID